MPTRTRTLGFVGFVTVIALCNLHLVIGTDPTILVFKIEKVANGDWWRIITHPFVHVSWYHLLLDCAALLLLWRELRLRSVLYKLLVAASCATASLLFSLLTSSAITQYGLCGFSGTAHGLTLFLGIYWLAEAARYEKTSRLLLSLSGMLLVMASLGKSAIEVITGNVIFSPVHMGNLGIPIVESHLGGVIGGIGAALIWLAVKKFMDPQRRLPVPPALRTEDLLSS